MPCFATPANAGGFVSDMVQGIPVVGPAAKKIDEGIAGVKDRGSQADVLHQATGLESWNKPVGKPANAGQR
jgi:hypothetical protein